jgi:hypothetical protein
MMNTVAEHIITISQTQQLPQPFKYPNAGLLASSQRASGMSYERPGTSTYSAVFFSRTVSVETVLNIHVVLRASYAALPQI